MASIRDKRRGQIVDANGNPMVSDRGALTREISNLRRQIVNARYDAAQDTDENINHWAQADNLDPHASANPVVRQRLRSRSRYEVLENNPYLKGTLLSISNDFVGGGPKLRITDKRIPKELRRKIELRWREYAKVIKLRKKLWRMRMAKIVDGETFAINFINKRLRYPVNLDYHVIEAEQVTSYDNFNYRSKDNEIDGIKFDDFLQPIAYHVLNRHPGSSFINGGALTPELKGAWVKSQNVIHWFRQDRGWLRGIPELTPSLQLCAILRRYTLAIVRHAETAASMTAIIETEGPASNACWTDESGNIVADDPFDVFPVERGQMMNLPWGYHMKQLQAVPLGVQYDEFVGSLLREITRPLLTVYNLVTGTSKDSNMASAVVDNNLYVGGQKSERRDCNEEVLDHILENWWRIGTRTSDYFDDVMSPTALLQDNPSLKDALPMYEWGWDNIGIEHTDPNRVASALTLLREDRIMTDRDIQETRFNRDVEEWREEVMEDEEFRKKLVPKEEGKEGNQKSPQSKESSDE